MKALIIGLGSIGIRHLHNLKALGINNISVFRQRKLSPPGEVDSNIKIFRDIDEALNKRYDIIVISNPTSMHLEYAEKAIIANSHVYIEKPISNNFVGIDNFIKLCEKNKSIVQVGCQLRCHPQLKKIKKWIDSGELGKIYSVVTDVGEYLPNWHPWEDYKNSYAAREDLGGGIILTMIHEIDYLYWLFGPLEVENAMGGKLTSLGIDVEDTALISMKANEIPIHLRMDYWRKRPVRSMNIVSENSEILWDYYNKELLLYKDGKLIIEDYLQKNWDRNELFLSIMEDFVNAINNNKPVCSPIKDGARVLSIALSAKEKLTI